MTTGENLTLHSLWEDLLTVVRRRRNLILLTTLSAVAAVYLGLLFVSDQYEAQASLLVRLGRENMDVPVTVERGSVFSDGVKKEEVNSYIALLTSQPLMLSAIDEIGVDRFLSPGAPPPSLAARLKYFVKRGVHWGKAQVHELLIHAALSPRLSEREQIRLLLQKNLNAYQVKDSDVIDITLRLPDPVLARDFLTVLTRKYLDRHAEIRQQADSVTQVFEDQAKVYSDRLADLREQSTKLKADLGVSSVTEQKLQLLEMLKVADLGNLESERQLAALHAEETALAARRPQLDEQLIASQVVAPSAAETKAKELLADLRVQKAQALAKYDADAAPVNKINLQITELENLTNSVLAEDNGPKTYTPNPIVAHMNYQEEDDRVRIATLEAGINKGNEQIAQIKVDLQRMDRAETDLQKLQLEINVAESRFVANASKREEARTDEIMDRLRLANIAVLSPPSFGEKPVSPKRLLTVVLGLFMGLVLGVGLGFALEWQSDVIHDARDLERASAGAYLGAWRGNGQGSGVERPDTGVFSKSV